MRRTFCPGASLLLVVLVTGCYNLPEPKVTERAAFEAARQVIESRYPLSASSVENGFVVATTPVALEGNTKTRKQISVVMKRNYTGSYEPVVRVRHLAEVGTPFPKSDPQTDDLGVAVPLAQDEWRTLGYLPNEEVELSNAILAKLQPKGM